MDYTGNISRLVNAKKFYRNIQLEADFKKYMTLVTVCNRYMTSRAKLDYFNLSAEIHKCDTQTFGPIFANLI